MRANILNFYCRKIGIWFLSLIPTILAVILMILALSDFLPLPEDSDIYFLAVATALYSALIVVAAPFALNGYFQEKAFNDEIKRIRLTGLLITGVEGFDDIESSIKLLYRGSYSVTGTVIISFLVFVSAQLLDKTASLFLTARLFIFVASIGLLAISSGASIILRLPDKSALQPGGLMRFYSPKSLPLKLDNIITDSILTRLDPITRVRMDEWSNSILGHINPNFLPVISPQTRLERGREKILLMVYLKEFLPELMTEDVFKQEIIEIMEPNYLNDFLQGTDSGISEKTLITIIKDVSKEIPQIFKLIQRIFVLVMDNLNELRNKETFITISHPTVHMGNIDPFRIIIFVLNLTKQQKKVKIQAQTSMSSLDPDDASQTLYLDLCDIQIPSSDQKLKFSSSSDPIDVLRLVSGILQVGDAINLQFRPNRFGTHVLNIFVEDPDHGILDGRSTVIEVSRDLNYYIKTFGGKILGYVGAAISFIGIGMGSLVGLFGF